MSRIFATNITTFEPILRNYKVACFKSLMQLRYVVNRELSPWKRKIARHYVHDCDFVTITTRQHAESKYLILTANERSRSMTEPFCTSSMRIRKKNFQNRSFYLPHSYRFILPGTQLTPILLTSDSVEERPSSSLYWNVLEVLEVGAIRFVIFILITSEGV